MRNHKTHFDRYDPDRAAVARALALSLAENPGQEEVSVLSLGCSTGENSLDLLTDLYVELNRISDETERRVHMVALDIEPMVIETARKGEYILERSSEGEDVLRAPWIELRDNILSVRWDIMEFCGWSLDYRVFDVDEDLRLACGEERFDLVEMFNCHNRGGGEAENFARVLSPGGMILYGHPFCEFQYELDERNLIPLDGAVQLPDYIPPTMSEFVRSCTDRDALKFIAEIVDDVGLFTGEECTPLSHDLCSMKKLEALYAFKRFSAYLYEFKDADDKDKQEVIKSSDLMRYMIACSSRACMLSVFQERVFRLYCANADPRELKNLLEFHALAIKDLDGFSPLTDRRSDFGEND
ncbi:hypothetical protein HOG17_04365 [Candidatus Peregrinibacteria bacterium]|nr:hypothetical protein [Candidatus Peregrinibacteria bacterium]MBT4148456.1 hypothetical protein [Candidatus Peregrinibacteria bacterium]MBT4366537.1 hypothetical protein [Candidatus Peregrinibacteria bacterium]MBT4456497.1 hypothetical protein [Candidatus Peregrinibacteria bacterium]